MSHKENTPDILFAGEKSFENPSAFFGYDRDDVFEKWPVKGASERIQELTKKTLKGEIPGDHPRRQKPAGTQNVPGGRNALYPSAPDQRGQPVSGGSAPG